MGYRNLARNTHLVGTNPTAPDLKTAKYKVLPPEVKTISKTLSVVSVDWTALKLKIADSSWHTLLGHPPGGRR